MKKSLKSTASYYKGIHGERIASDYFSKQGYEILLQRYQSSAGEVDLVLAKDQILIFVEIKARPTIDDCLNSISKRQQARIMTAAECFLSDNFATYQHYDLRFDVIAVDQNENITHFENAFGQY
jgi:putative endonuclease